MKSKWAEILQERIAIAFDKYRVESLSADANDKVNTDRDQKKCSLLRWPQLIAAVG
jgi:hypothetical protein